MKPFVKRKKNDAADAGAVCEIASRPAMRFVAAERAERQAEGMPFRTRTRRRGTEDADRQRAARAYGERGVAPPQGIAYTARLTAALEDPESRLPDAVRKLGGLLLDPIGIPTGRIKELKAEILKRPPESGEAKRLMDIPGTAPSAPRRSGPVQRNEGLPVPMNYHYAGMFYNTKVFADAGITEMPTTWDEFLALCETLKAAGVTPVALGSLNRWPAQFWFDYLILRTAGPEYRAALMDGSASYDDPEVMRAMSIWMDLVDGGNFLPNSNADSWTDASDKVARGDAAMTLMGTWITGYWNGLGLEPGTDYDFFEFPMIDDGVANAVVGPVDGWVVSANAENVPGAKAFLAEMISNPESQAKWAQAQGALSANVNVDPAAYNAVMLKAFEAVAAADVFAFNYDLATPPPVAEVGLSMFQEFMDSPGDYARILGDAQSAAADPAASRQRKWKEAPGSGGRSFLPRPSASSPCSSSGRSSARSATASRTGTDSIRTTISWGLRTSPRSQRTGCSSTPRSTR